MEHTTIHDVSDTALWVAVYRAQESERPDALFKDPYAKMLAGEKGRAIAKSMSKASRYTSWSVVIRTYIIDNYIQRLIAEGVDTIVNLGAGLDTRPYRMNLPAHLQWIEVDYPHMMQLKDEKLALEKPRCHLQRIKMDLAQRKDRLKLFAEINSRSQKVLILTEGVIPYLTEEQVAELAEDIYSQMHFTYWLLEYFSPKLYKYMRSKQRQRLMKNAPMQFFPEDWGSFFAAKNWTVKEMRYLPEETAKVGRVPPLPLFARVLRLFMSKKVQEATKKFSAYALLEKK